MTNLSSKFAILVFANVLWQSGQDKHRNAKTFLETFYLVCHRPSALIQVKWTQCLCKTSCIDANVIGFIKFWFKIEIPLTLFKHWILRFNLDNSVNQSFMGKLTCRLSLIHSIKWIAISAFSVLIEKCAIRPFA